uniref:Uncharacterized protein n=1 Tax=viral metagenome TaxID=1070528 RepID=A0A6C0JIC6_9ZZZZ
MDKVKKHMLIRSLLIHTLPIRTLPHNVLHMIKEYSRPLTKPNWRRSKPIISTYQLYLRCRLNIQSRFKLHCIIINNIYKTDWFYMYIFIKDKGIYRYCYYNNICDSTIVNIDGIKEAVYLYNGNNLFYEYRCVY